MPRNNRNLNKNSTGGRANRPTRGPYSSNSTPLSGNDPQLPFIPIITPSVPAPERQTSLAPYDDLNGPAFIMPVWNDPIDVVSEVSRLVAQSLRQEQSSNARQPSSPILKRVRKLRVAEQQRTVVQLEGRLRGNSSMELEAHMVSEHGSKPHLAAKLDMEMSPKTKKAIPELEISDQDWATPLYMLANAPKATLPAQTTGANPGPGTRRQSTVANAQSVNGSADSSDDDVDALVKAIANMHPFQNIASLPPNPRALHQESVVPAVSKQAKSQVRKDGDSDDFQKEAARITTSSKNEAEKAKGAEMTIELNKSMGSVESFASAASDDFERVEVLKAEETEHNGAKRKWFKGYRH